MRLIVLFIFLTCSPFFLQPAQAQNGTIKGRIIDGETKEPLPFVHITTGESGKGTVSDIQGQFSIELKPGLTRLNFSAVGYEKEFRLVEAKAHSVTVLTVEMMRTAQLLETTVVSAGRYEQKQQELTTTVDVIQPALIQNKNTITMDKAVEQTPGVAVVDNEPQVRGGSGFSSGLGSRILILVDDMPLMRVDVGRPVWELLPVENVEQIEVLKGASSVLYGSMAMNGVINVRTAFAKEKPETRVNLFSGLYELPKGRRWYSTRDRLLEGRVPFFSGLGFNHARKQGSWDIVIGGNFYFENGFVGPEKLKPDTTFVKPSDLNSKNKGRYDRRGRINFSVRHRNQKVEGLVYGLSGNVMVQHQAESYFWYDDTTGMYVSFPGSLYNYKDVLLYLDPFITHYAKSGDRHTARGRYFLSHNDADKDQFSQSHNFFAEYQYQRFFKKIGFNLITGLSGQYTSASSRIFIGLPGGGNRSHQQNAALYLQLEKKMFKRLTVLGGARFEYFEINGLERGKPVFRTGMNLMLTEATYLRGSWGQGFRFPSIGERYILTNVGGFGFFPNPDLLPENSWSAEGGIKQLYRIRNFGGFVDLCGFYQHYENFVEFNSGRWGQTGNISKDLGFRFLNTGKARVWGLEASVAGSGKFSDRIEFQMFGGYTYTLPQTLTPNYVYARLTWLPNKDTITYLNSTVGDTARRILKYRIQHLVKWDCQLNVKLGRKNRHQLFAGFSVRYYSKMQSIDRFFYDLDTPTAFATGIRHYRDRETGNTVGDARVGVILGETWRVAWILNNITNRAYALRPMSPSEPRTWMLQLGLSL